MKARDAKVLLTGASGGIGRASAQALLAAGATVMLIGRSAPKLSALARELDTPRVAWHAMDIAAPDAAAQLRELAQRCRANVLVNNAGVPSFGALSTLDPAHLEQVLRTNLLAPMLLTQALLPVFERLPKAQIIQVGSVLGALALPGYSVYSAGKFGLRGFTEALRRELAGGPVKLQYLGPRSTRTDFNDARVEAYNRATGTRMDAPERVAAALLELLHSEAPERFVGFPEALAVRLNGLAPRRLDAAFKAHRDSLASAPQPDLSNAPR